jgi:Mg2+-importing ATPase
LVVMALGAWLPFSPFAHWLGFVPLPAGCFLWIAGFLLAHSAITHGVKMWFANKVGID